MRLLLTGAAGFLGASVLDHLLDAKHEVAVILRRQTDRWRIEKRLSEVRVIEADLEDLPEAREAVLDFAPDAVAHLAWRGTGIRAEGSGAVVRMSQSSVFGNNIGLEPVSSGLIQSFSNNQVAGNFTSNGAPTSNIAPS